MAIARGTEKITKASRRFNVLSVERELFPPKQILGYRVIDIPGGECRTRPEGRKRAIKGEREPERYEGATGGCSVQIPLWFSVGWKVGFFGVPRREMRHGPEHGGNAVRETDRGVHSG
jgi:hypothetical protein